jgi:hypothetical protein
MAVFQVVGDLYTNSLLATLNARNMLRNEQQRLREESALRIHPLSTDKSGTIDGSSSLLSSSKMRGERTGPEVSEVAYPRASKTKITLKETCPRRSSEVELVTHENSANNH